MDFIDRVSSFEYSIWVVCAFLYLIDHVKLLRENELIYEQTPFGSWFFRLSKVPFSIWGKDLYLINPLFPWTCAFKVLWGEKGSRRKKMITRERHKLFVFAYHLLYMRVTSTISFIAMFILGPYVTATRGLVFSIITIVATHSLLNLATVPVLWAHRSTYRLRKVKIIFLLLENIVCFPYTAVLVKRLCLNYKIQCDGLMLAKTLQPSTNFLAILENAAERLLGRVEQLAGSPSCGKEIQEYILKVRSF